MTDRLSRDELVERMARAIALSHGGRIVGPGQSTATREIGWRGDGEHLEIYAERHWKEHAHAADFALTELEKHVPNFAKLLDGWVAVPEIPPFPKMFKVRGEHADTNSGKLERKTVWLGWTDEGGGWYQWGSEGSAKLFATEKSARAAAKGKHGPWYNTPAQETIEVVEAESRKAKDYRAAIAARPR